MVNQQNLKRRILIIGNRLTKAIIPLVVAGVLSIIFFLISLLPLQAMIPSVSSTVADPGNIPNLNPSSGCSPDPVKIFTYSGNQEHPQVAYNPISDQYLVVWEDNRSGKFDIYGRIMKEGCPYDGSSGVIKISRDTQDIINQTLPHVVYNGDRNEYFVIWHDVAEGVVGKIFSNTGQPVGDEETFFFAAPGRVFTNSVVSYDGANQRYLLLTQRIEGNAFAVHVAIISTPNLEVVTKTQISPVNKRRQLGDVASNQLQSTNLAVWVDLDSPNLDIYAQGFDGDEGHIINQEMSIAVAAEVQSSPSLDFNEQCQGYLITWEDARNLNKNDIFRQHISDNLTIPLQPELPLLTTLTQTEKKPDIATHAITQEYLVAWQTKNDDNTHYNIYAQRVDCAGVPLPDQNLVQVSNLNEDQVSPTIAYLARERKYLVIWSGKTAGTGFDIFAQVVDAGEDITRPKIQDTTPQDGSIDVPVSTLITIRFSEGMSTETVDLSITPSVGVQPNPFWRENDQIVTFTLKSPLVLSRTYKVEVTGKDKMGNKIVDEKYSWSFTTKRTASTSTFLPFITQCYPFFALENKNFEPPPGVLSPWIKEEVNGHTVKLICADDGKGYASLNKTCVVRLGDPFLGSDNPHTQDIPNGHAAVSQRITIPCSGSPVLKFDYHFCSYDIKEWKGGLRDALEISLGPAGPVIGSIGPTHPDLPPDYLYCPPSTYNAKISLSSYRGRVVNLTFTLWNREHGQAIDQGDGYRKTWFYIDNIRVE